jgi:hypothetical protein
LPIQGCGRERTAGFARRHSVLAGVFLVASFCTLPVIGSSAARSAAGVVNTLDAGDVITVRLEPGTSLRGLAEKFLNDPDLWPVILRLNGIDDIAEIAEGQELVLPGNQVRLAATALDASLAEIQKANEAGAQLFAPTLIKDAIDFRDQAMVENNNGVFQQSIALSSRSISTAGAARTTSEQKRDVEAEARLSDRQGWVEGQKVSENSWSERERDAVLNEQEKLRTLSASTAQVVFRDASRLRLNPNSQAVIQRMRDDPLKRREEAQISLVEGDFYALLAPGSDRSRLEVNLANVDAKIDSGNFWVSQDAGGAKFSNFDSKPVAIVSGEDTLVLGRNEGAIVKPGEAPKDKVAVIGRVTLTTPDDNAVVAGGHVRLAWQEIEGGDGYWVEIAFDPRFDRMTDSLWDVEQDSTDELALAPGTYYWRVAALDALGLPGPMSTVRKFEVRNDNSPPFLQIGTPEPGAILRDAAVTISGETEAGTAVLVDGVVADVDVDGRFFMTIQAAEGDNDVTVVARDPAGNETSRRIAFTYLRDARRDVVYDARILRDAAGRFLTASRQFDLSGVVTEGAKVSVLGARGDVRSETYADQAGHFALKIALAARQETLELRVTTASGYAYQETIEAAVSDQPPRFRLSEPLPQVTSRRGLDLAVEAEAGTSVTVNGAAPEIGEGLAHFHLDLAQGANLVEIVGSNALGLVAIEKHTVLFDNQKPEMTDREIVAEDRGDTEMLSIRIGARDQSGLALTSRFRVRSGSDERVDVLRYNKARKSYQGTMELPRRPEGSSLTIVVELVDVAGNVNELEFVQ